MFKVIACVTQRQWALKNEMANSAYEFTLRLQQILEGKKMHNKLVDTDRGISK